MLPSHQSSLLLSMRIYPSAASLLIAGCPYSSARRSPLPSAPDWVLLPKRGTRKLVTEELSSTAAPFPFPFGSPSSLQNTPHVFPWSSKPSHRKGTIRLNEVSVPPSHSLGLAKLPLFNGACLDEPKKPPSAFLVKWWRCYWHDDIWQKHKTEWFEQQSESRDTWVFAWASFIWRSLHETCAATPALRVMAGCRVEYLRHEYLQHE